MSPPEEIQTDVGRGEGWRFKCVLLRIVAVVMGGESSGSTVRLRKSEHATSVVHSAENGQL